MRTLPGYVGLKNKNDNFIYLFFGVFILRIMFKFGKHER